MPPSKCVAIGGSGGAPVLGKTMFRTTQLRFATIALFAAAAVSLTAASARAFNQENGGVGGGSNSTFADADEQVNIFGYGGGAQPSGLNGPVQFGAQRGLTPFRHFQSDGLSCRRRTPFLARATEICTSSF